MSAPNELNDLVLTGKDDVDQIVRSYFHDIQTTGSETERRLCMTATSLLSLAMRHGGIVVDAGLIKKRFIDENYETLSQMPSDNGHLLPLLAIVTGRITEVEEYIAALRRVGDTYSAQDEGMLTFLDGLIDALGQASIAGCRFGLNQNGVPELLPMPELGGAPSGAMENRPAVK